MAWTVMPSIEISSSSGDSANWCKIRLRYGSYYFSVESSESDPVGPPFSVLTKANCKQHCNFLPDRKTPERFCLNVTEESVNWRKWCRDIIVNGRRVGAKENSNRYCTVLVYQECDIHCTINTEKDK